MAAKRTRQSDDRDELQTSHKRGRPRTSQLLDEPDESNEVSARAKEEESDDEEFDLGAIPDVTEARVNEPDPRAVDDLTDRIFSSVLSRYGWERNGNRIEKVNEERPHRH